MYSLSISFGPTGLVWAFLFKEQKNAGACLLRISDLMAANEAFTIEDDYGQSGIFHGVHGLLLESLEMIEEARIQRSLADERCKAKFMQRAKSDPVIRAAMGQSGPSVLTPFPGR